MKVFRKIIFIILVILAVFLILVAASCIVPTDTKAGMFISKIPYLEYMRSLIPSGVSLILCISVLSIIILAYVSSFAADMTKNLSRHKKRIERKRKRRNDRYIKEGLHRKAVV